MDQNSYLGIIATQIIPRIAVPFFFIVSGYYYINKLEKEENCIAITLWKTIKLYVFWSIVYIVRNFIVFVLNSNINSRTIKNFIIDNVSNFFINGTEYHLWYFLGIIASIIIVGFAYKLKIQKPLFDLTILLFGLGLLGESYYSIGNQIPIIKEIINLSSFSIIRRVFLMGLPFFESGYFVIVLENKNSKKSSLIKLMFCIIAFLLEIGFVCKMHTQRSFVITIFLYPLTLYTLIVLLKNPLPKLNALSAKTRSLANYTYYVHPLFITSLVSISKILNITLLNIVIMIVVLFLCFSSWLVLNKINIKLIKNYVI